MFSPDAASTGNLHPPLVRISGLSQRAAVGRAGQLHKLGTRDARTLYANVRHSIWHYRLVDD